MKPPRPPAWETAETAQTPDATATSALRRVMSVVRARPVNTYIKTIQVSSAAEIKEFGDVVSADVGGSSYLVDVDRSLAAEDGEGNGEKRFGSKLDERWAGDRMT